MERKDFIEALENRTSLSKQTKAAWASLASEYPYASVVQLLSHLRMDNPNKADIKKLLLHFDHPLHLAVVKAKNVTKEQVEEVKEVVSKERKEVIEKKGIATEDKERKDKDAVEAEKKDAVPEVKETFKANTIANELPTAVEDPKADVLELINKLPEQNPIKLPEESIDEEVLPKEDKDMIDEDPGDLMVMMSFTDWLHHFKAKSEHEAEEKKGKDAIRSAWQKEKLAEAMDDEEDVVPDDIFEKAMKSVSFGDGLVTEPLAELYVKQGKTEKAIELYKKLSLLNPEKRTYFASRIKDLHLLK